MKNFKTTITILFIGFLSILPASANVNIGPDNPQNAEAVLRSEIIKLLGTYDFKLDNLHAQVSLLLNNKNELVVLGVKTKNTNLDYFIKSRLNYKKVKISGIEKGTLFRIPLKFNMSN